MRDGEIVVDEVVATNEYVATGLTGNAWYYYTLFLEVGGDWKAVAYASSIAIADTGMRGVLWDRIPEYFKHVPENLTGLLGDRYVSAEIFDRNDVEPNNFQLQQFLNVLGWGLDDLRNLHNTVLWANDPRLTHLRNLELLAQMTGQRLEHVPAYLNRSKVAHATDLAKNRGTFEGLRDLVVLSTGWDLELELADNLVLTEDNGSFTNPQYPEWTPYVNYAGWSEEPTEPDPDEVDPIPTPPPPGTGYETLIEEFRGGSVAGSTKLRGWRIHTPEKWLQRDKNAVRIFKVDSRTYIQLKGDKQRGFTKVDLTATLAKQFDDAFLLDTNFKYIYVETNQPTSDARHRGFTLQTESDGDVYEPVLVSRSRASEGPIRVYFEPPRDDTTGELSFNEILFTVTQRYRATDQRHRDYVWNIFRIVITDTLPDS